jgi:porin
MASPEVTVTSMLLNTTDASTTTGFSDIGDGTTWSTAVDLQHRLGGLPGGATLAFLYGFDGNFDRIGGLNLDPGGGITLGTKSHAFAGYASLWQYLYTEEEPPDAVDPRDGRQDLQGVGSFLMLGLADEDTNPSQWSVAAGLSGRGLIPGRDDDTCGLGYFYNNLQSPETAILNNFLSGSTQGLEAYYNIAVTRSVALSLDFQWTDSAIRQLDDAVVLGLRLNIRF